MIEGDKIVKEAIAAQYPLKLIAGTRNWLIENASVIPTDVEFVETSEQELDRISQLSSPQPVVAVAFQKNLPAFDPLVVKGWVIALDSINDPGNLGTILRSAEWFGVKNILCSPDCADMYNAKVVQASMGSIFRMPVYYADLQLVLKKMNVTKYAACLTGRPVYNESPAEDGLLVVGSESHGISDDVMQCCDVQVTIPGKGNAESLNAAVACSVMLSHLISTQ